MSKLCPRAQHSRPGSAANRSPQCGQRSAAITSGGIGIDPVCTSLG
jgi:hypothetical protein